MSTAPALTSHQQVGRAINVIGQWFRDSLTVPEIFVNPLIARVRLDLLAVDKAGGGDIHAVQVKTNISSLPAPKLKQWMEEAHQIPAHFRYLALDPVAAKAVGASPFLFADDGIGRIGILSVSARASGPPEIRLVAKPERFRLIGPPLQKIESFLKTAKPDFFVRV
jgi:hypothetical protein